MAYEYTLPAHIIVGEKALEKAGHFFKSFGKKALIVTGKHVVKSEMMQELKETLSRLGISYVIFDGITGEPTDVMIEEGVKVYQENACEFCIGIGGGSPLDSAKAIAAMTVNEGSIADYNGKVMTKEIPPVAAIPTTAGTGSEATMFTIITDTKKGIKMLLKGEVLIPKLAIVDPAFTISSPTNVTAATGLDALTHAVEAYTSKKAFCMTDTLALSAVKRIFKYLPVAYKDGTDLKAREEMAVAALEAGICINNSSVTLVHGMSRPIGALFHVPHGISNAMLLTTCLSFALDGAYKRFAELGRVIGAATRQEDDEAAAKEFIEELTRLCHTCGVPTLEAYGIEREAFFAAIDKMSQDAVDSGSPGNTRKPVTVEDIKKLYQALWAY